jgi:hypothetical protein
VSLVPAGKSLLYRGEPWVDTLLAAVVFQSQRGVLDVVNKAGDNRENDRKLMALLDQHTRTPSPGFETLRARLRSGDTD